ncbi:hypothetical protein RND71_013248 [Anisodus tanguticus]|uniref:Germin-like protein n=1 Tax=Anisodus tanguticus TaxID=243964 RepID=A0AAE1SIM6_9SOLA|nr:hypothetical protein RND71_013248 [Anisodus tanguticus]
MESKISSCIVLLALAISLGIFQMASAGDPDILTDFVMPLEVPSVECFLLHLLRPEGPRDKGKHGRVSSPERTKRFLRDPACSVNPVHTHPRASELLFLVSGMLEVGFIDSTNKMFNQMLQTGDVFVFPKRLVHYQYNGDATNCA